MADDSGAVRRPGRRGNGLAAATYVPLAELDPRLADAALQALREAGVAAYVAPSTGTVGGYLEVSLPDRPADRVWVDSAARQRAQGVLADLADRPGSQPGSEPAQDEDESWRAIVATFQAEPSDAPAWPAAEGLGTEGPTAGRLVRPAGPAQPSSSAGNSPGDAGDEDFEDTEPDDDEHYVPPVPPPVPQPHPVTRWAALAVIGGLAVLILPTVFSDPVGPGLALLAVLAVVGGFGTLVARMRDDPPTDSGPDDGAVV